MGKRAYALGVLVSLLASTGCATIGGSKTPDRLSWWQDRMPDRQVLAVHEIRPIESPQEVIYSERRIHLWERFQRWLEGRPLTAADRDPRVTIYH